MRLGLCAAFLFFLLGISAFPSLSAAGTRDARRLGVVGGWNTEPFPSLLGISASVNAAPMLRLSLGIGGVADFRPAIQFHSRTIAAEAKLLVTGWEASPYFCMGVAAVTIHNARAFDLHDLGGLTRSTVASYIGVGWDVQIQQGFNLGVSYKHLLIAGGTGAPGLYAGWYF